MWPLTSQIGASGTGHRVQKLVAEGLFSGAAVNESGAAVHRLLQLGCERSGIVTWITGQRAGVSDPDFTVFSSRNCYFQNPDLGKDLDVGGPSAAVTVPPGQSLAKRLEKTPRGQQRVRAKKCTRVEFKVTLCYLMTPKRMLVHSESL